MLLLFAQLSGCQSLREIQAAWNVHANSHFHLGCAELRRSTLADANARRPVAVFSEAFELLVKLVNRTARRDTKQFVHLIDSTPIPLGKLFKWAKWNGRIRGMKAHMVYDPDLDLPRILDITDANVNDAQIGVTGT